MRYVDDLSQVKPEEIQHVIYGDILGIVRRTACKGLSCEFVVVSEKHACSYTIDGRAYEGSEQVFIHKPKKVRYLKPLHVILAENPGYGFEALGGVMIGMTYVSLTYLSDFGKPVDSLWWPESWIEEKEEEEV